MAFQLKKGFVPLGEAEKIIVRGYTQGLNPGELDTIIGNNIKTSNFLTAANPHKSMREEQHKATLAAKERIEHAIVLKWKYMSAIGQREEVENLAARHVIIILRNHGMTEQQISKQTGIRVDKIIKYGY